MKKANSSPGKSHILEAFIFQWGGFSSQKVREPFLNVTVPVSSLPKISEATIKVEPDGKFMESEAVCTTLPPSKIPSSVAVLKSSV